MSKFWHGACVFACICGAIACGITGHADAAFACIIGAGILVMGPF